MLRVTQLMDDPLEHPYPSLVTCFTLPYCTSAQVDVFLSARLPPTPPHLSRVGFELATVPDRTIIYFLFELSEQSSW